MKTIADVAQPRIVRARINPFNTMLLVSALIATLAISGPGWGAAAADGKVVTYAAPAGETLSTVSKVEAGGQKVDVYAARVLDPPFAGKEV